MTDNDASVPPRITTRQEFAAALTALRVRADLTVRDVAKVVGVPHQTVGDYFGGKHLPPRTSDVLERILGACGVDEPATVAAWVEALQRLRHRALLVHPDGEACVGDDWSGSLGDRQSGVAQLAAATDC